MNQLVFLSKLIGIGLCSVALASCGTFKKVRTITTDRVERDAWGKPSSYKLGKDEAGNPQMKSDKRSSFEQVGANNIVSGKNYRGQEYTKKSYRKDRWGGDSAFRTDSYHGAGKSSRYEKSPWFLQKQAGVQGQEASMGKKSFMTKLFGKKTAREAGVSELARPSDVETDVRRRVFKQPEITGWKNQSGLSVNDTNSLLGR